LRHGPCEGRTVGYSAVKTKGGGGGESLGGQIHYTSVASLWKRENKIPKRLPVEGATDLVQRESGVKKAR